MRLVLFFLFTVAVHAATFTGKVVGVSDGDTITVLTPANESVKVRLYGIDAPEAKQAFGSRAKQALSILVFGKEVVVEVQNKDRYGRTVGRISADGLPVNVEMVRRGLAWWYRDYAKQNMELAAAQAEAQNAKRGLWVDKRPIPPWEFRRSESASRATKKAASEAAR